jgi:hypothetical protein
MLGLDIIVVYLLLPCLVWTTMWYIYCCHALFGQQCGIFTVAMLCLDNNVVYLLLPCFAWTTMWLDLLLPCMVWTTMWYSFNGNVLLGQQSATFIDVMHCLDNNFTFRVAMLGLDNNVAYLLLSCLV